MGLLSTSLAQVDALSWGQLVAVAALGVAIGLAVWVAWAFNRLVRRHNLVREGWSGIDVQLKRRHDLVPNLVEAVKGYAGHEHEVLEEVVALRGKAEALQDRKALRESENQITSRLQRVFALAEDYPDLKADRNFRQLADQLVEIEDALQYARRYYNGATRDFNITVESFPSNLVARGFRFTLADYFEIAVATERSAPKVKL